MGHDANPAVSVELLGQLVPGPAAAGRPSLRANNNVDLCVFAGHLHLAWRSAPNHFAGVAARILVSSTPYAGGGNPASARWRAETAVEVGADLREPRLAEHGGKLHLFCMELGTDPRRFQPRRTWRLESDSERWSAPQLAIADPVVPWRARHPQGVSAAPPA